MQRLRSRGSTFLGSLAVPQLRRRALNSWGAIQDTYYSTKEIFESHKVVFTIGTSIASVATAWFGYSLRHYHQSKVDQRLESIENALKNDYHFGHAEFKKLVDPGTARSAAWVATAGTTLIIGYGLGWRSGTWYANRKFRREQMKLLGQLKPKRWQLLGQIPRGWPLRFLKRPLTRYRVPENVAISSEKMKKDASIMPNPGETHQSC